MTTAPPLPADASLDDRIKAAGGGFTFTREPQNPTLTGYNGDVIATIEWMEQGNEQIR